MGNEFAVILCVPVDGSDDNSNFGQHLYSDRTQSRAILCIVHLSHGLDFGFNQRSHVVLWRRVVQRHTAMRGAVKVWL